MDNKLELYWDPASQPCRAVASLLIAGDVTYESHYVDLGSDKQHSDEIKALNPRCKIPFLRYKGKTITESAAILRFLCTEFPDKLQQFYPADNILRAQIDAALDWNGTELRKSWGPAWEGYIIGKLITHMNGELYASIGKGITEG